MDKRRTTLIGLTAATGMALAITTMVGHGQNVNSGQVFAEPPVPQRSVAQNLATKITTPFTVATVGDVMVKRAGAEMADPVFQGAFQIIRDADVGFGNMEGNLSDLEHFDGPLRGMMGDKDVAPALKKIGFDLMNRANNHIFDSDREGHVFDDGAARCGGHRARGHGKESRGCARAGVSRHAEGPRRRSWRCTRRTRPAILRAPRTRPATWADVPA